MSSVTEIFGSMVFDDTVMKQRLSDDTYKAMQKTIRDGRKLDITIANSVANAMKDWAIEKGATHFTHWFQPLTGFTAEKHDSFISPSGNGKIIMEFSGKELVKGESDASSFPSGGLRATFEARGYTAWDPTTYAFIKDDTLYIPTAFCSFGGEALDMKTPLLRSMELINKQALRVLKLFGNENVTSVKTTVGPEQEYFLIPNELFEARKDLVYTGRTLFGAKPPKGQELDDHYYGQIKPRVKEYMKDLNKELWKLGILAKTEHNEAAPSQHELAPIYTTTNIACDHNQLTMELMQRVAKKHGLVCLLHEKPFEGVNGSGKHNNWSLITNTGVNLLDPGETPYENAQFLLFLCAVIKAVDEYQDLLRASVASAGNDHRLGGHEAPPAVISIFLGDELNEILDAIEHGEEYDSKEKSLMKIGVHTLPRFSKDTTDRNRTSPFAFTNNKFEFRMLGSSLSVTGPNFILNTAVADALENFADTLESASDFESGLNELIINTIKKHKRIIFNGNGYDASWLEEAKKRGLSNLESTPEALSALISEKNIELFSKHKVLSETELRARYDINLENYCKIINIEALTMVEMVKRDILPAVSEYGKEVSLALSSKKNVSAQIDCSYEEETITNVSGLTGELFTKIKKLEAVISHSDSINDHSILSFFCRDEIIPAMKEVRKIVDELENIVSSQYWPYPTYGDLLFGVR